MDFELEDTLEQPIEWTQDEEKEAGEIELPDSLIKAIEEDTKSKKRKREPEQPVKIGGDDSEKKKDEEKEEDDSKPKPKKKKRKPNNFSSYSAFVDSVKQVYERNVGPQGPKYNIHKVDLTTLYHVIEIMSKSGYQHIIDLHLNTFMSNIHKTLYSLNSVSEGKGYVSAYEKFFEYTVNEWIKTIKTEQRIDLITFRCWDSRVQDYALRKLEDGKVLNTDQIRKMREDHMVLPVSQSLLTQCQQLIAESPQTIRGMYIDVQPRSIV